MPILPCRTQLFVVDKDVSLLGHLGPEFGAVVIAHHEDSLPLVVSNLASLACDLEATLQLFDKHRQRPALAARLGGFAVRAILRDLVCHTASPKKERGQLRGTSTTATRQLASSSNVQCVKLARKQQGQHARCHRPAPAAFPSHAHLWHLFIFSQAQQLALGRPCRLFPLWQEPHMLADLLPIRMTVPELILDISHRVVGAHFFANQPVHAINRRQRVRPRIRRDRWRFAFEIRVNFRVMVELNLNAGRWRVCP